MRSVAAIVLFVLLLAAPVSAYSLYMSCPSQVNVGQTIKVTGNSSFPVGTSFDLAFYNAGYTATEIDRKTITLQEYNNKEFSTSFSTKGLKGGQYKVEVQFDSPKADQLSSDSESQTTCIVMVQDRSGEISITAPLTQTLSEALRIEGSISKLGDAGVEIEVRGPDGPVFGPTWIETKKDIKTGDGEFAKKIPVSVAGEYEIHFTDTKSYIGMATIDVAEPTTVPTTGAATKTTVRTTAAPATTTASTPAPTQSPPSLLVPLASLGAGAFIALLAVRKRSG